MLRLAAARPLGVKKRYIALAVVATAAAAEYAFPNSPIPAAVRTAVLAILGAS